ncbi:MAG: biosynthetic peptidoglycan transglycosylase [Eubacteriales bacterium]|nr:biosynthetic peptidoglycan transglycosylase [Eubacteriales bacterium]
MKKKIIGLMAAFFVTAAACCGFTAAGKGYEMYQAAVKETSLAEMVDSIRSKEGYTTLEELPDTYLNAVVSVEDHRFYSHFGLDPVAICRALVNDIRAGRYVEGGSTITQQLAKNLYFSQEKKMERKAAEVFLALELEKNYTKDEILELYVNSIYFGDGYDTAGDASRGYFGKEPSQMNEYEATLLAGVPNAPSRYAPTKNPQLAAKRQQQVLRRLEACGYEVQESTRLLAALAAEDSGAQIALNTVEAGWLSYHTVLL